MASKPTNRPEITIRIRGPFKLAAGLRSNRLLKRCEVDVYRGGHFVETRNAYELLPWWKR